MGIGQRNRPGNQRLRRSRPASTSRRLTKGVVHREHCRWTTLPHKSARPVLKCLGQVDGVDVLGWRFVHLLLVFHRRRLDEDVEVQVRRWIVVEGSNRRTFLAVMRRPAINLREGAAHECGTL